MRYYNFNTVFTFGKYKGQTIHNVAETEPDYIAFCILNLDHFVMRRETAVGLQNLYPGFALPEAAWKKISEKQARFDGASDHDYDDSESYSRRDADRDTFDALTDGQYGSYDEWGGDMDSLRDSLGY